MKTKKLTDKELFKIIINKQLEPFGKTIEDVLDDDRWLYKYPVSQEDNDKWVEWGTKFIMKHAELPLLRDKDRAKKSMNWINLSHGLSIKKENDKVNKPKKVRKTKTKIKTKT